MKSTAEINIQLNKLNINRELQLFNTSYIASYTKVFLAIQAAKDDQISLKQLLSQNTFAKKSQRKRMIKINQKKSQKAQLFPKIQTQTNLAQQSTYKINSNKKISLVSIFYPSVKG
ncbi:hypothetical protein ABPG74_011543 [Tetrahymena malaccensis]